MYDIFAFYCIRFSSLLFDVEKITFRMIFRGADNDNPVLCTESQTFQVKEAETSNALLLSPDCRFASNIIKDGAHRLSSCQVQSDVYRA